MSSFSAVMKSFAAVGAAMLISLPLSAETTLPGAVSNLVWLQKNFALSDAQVKKIESTVNADYQAMMNQAKSFSAKTDPDSAKKWVEGGNERWLKSMKELEKNFDQKQKANLDLFRNAWTNQNPRQLGMVYRLWLTYDQTAAIQAIFDKMRAERQGGGDGEKPDRAKMQERMKAMNAEVEKILDVDQNATYKAMRESMRGQMRRGGPEGKGRND